MAKKARVSFSKNTCYRCGRERIVLRVWTEIIDDSVIENTETVCPDKECQKIVLKEMLDQKTKRLQMEDRRKKIFMARRTRALS